jgi:hypothetical protein
MDSNSRSDYADIDIDISVDKIRVLVRNVIDSYQQSSKSLWNCAKYTWELFDQHGLYEKSFTSTLCEELAVQKDTIYHWRKAWDLWIKIGPVFPSIKQLSISHFYTAADYVEKCGLEFVGEWMEVAAEERWSSRKLAAELLNASGDFGTNEWFKKKLFLLRERFMRLYEMSEASGVEEENRMRMKTIISIINEIK